MILTTTNEESDSNDIIIPGGEEGIDDMAIAFESTILKFFSPCSEEKKRGKYIPRDSLTEGSLMGTH